jgi:endonuclease YncB( thermonuclease family)
MRSSGKVAAGLIGVVLVGAFLSDGDPSTARSTSAPGPDAGLTQSAAESEMPQESAADLPAGASLLQPAGGGDGDSWRDTAGTEYRLGLVNAPETNECYGAEATAKRTELTAGGFLAEVYTTDRYGRSVAVVTLPDGTNLNVLLARNGFVDDKYLQQFRAENPALASEVDVAFSAAKAERAGLWGACSGSSHVVAEAQPAPAPAPATGSCHPDYLTCVPIKGDGSGRGQANDLDCGQIGKRVQLRAARVDPYRLDANDDGVGCEAYP